MIHHGLHHLAARKKERQPFKWFDRLMYFIGIIGPLAILPQIIDIWVYGITDGVSVLTWSLLALGNCLWLIYGIAHRAGPVIAANFLFLLFNIFVVIGVLIR